MKNIFTKFETQWLIENYPQNGVIKCADYLNKTPLQIKHKIYILGRDKGLIIHLHPEIKRQRLSEGQVKEKLPHEYKVNPLQFINVSTPEAAYILGLLWADGYIFIRKKGNRNINEIRLSIVKDDFDEIRPVFAKTGQWATPIVHQKDRRIQVCCVTSNKQLATFLDENDYKSKSYTTAYKILSHIPENLKHYWFRGLVDGDGCFSFGKSYKFSICSAYEQDWTYVETLFKSLGVKYSIYQTISHKKHKHSTINVTNKSDILKFGAYLYEGYENDNIGFRRKYEKYKTLFQ